MNSCVSMFTLITMEWYPENVLTASYFITFHQGSFNANRYNIYKKRERYEENEAKNRKGLIGYYIYKYWADIS